MNEGLIIKRAHYCFCPETMRRNKRIKTASDLAGLENYFQAQDHLNHEGIAIRPVTYWNTSKGRFIERILGGERSYRAAAVGRPGQKASGDLAEHLIVAPDEMAFFSEDEEGFIERCVVENVCRDSPAATVRHSNPKTGRMELHVAVGSFTGDFPARLRVTELRRRYGADYLMILQDCGERIMDHINEARRTRNETPVRTLGTIRANHLKNLVGVLFEEAFPSSHPVETTDDIVDLLRRTSWRIAKKSKTRVDLLTPYADRPISLLWEDILSWTRHEMEFMTREREKARRDDRLAEREDGKHGPVLPER